MCPSASRLQAILERELYPQLLQILTFSSQILYFFQHKQHSYINLLMLLIFRPSSESSLMPICTATFCRAKSALTNHMLNPCCSCSYSLKLDTISAIFFSQFLLVIHPYSSSSSLDEEDTFLLGFTGTDIHYSSSSFAAQYLQPFYSIFLVYCSLLLPSSPSSYDSDSESIQFSLTYSSKSSFSMMGGGSFLKACSSPSFLQRAYVTAISSISTWEREAISPVFLANYLTRSKSLSSQSTTSISQGRLSTNSFVFISLSSSRTSEVVINLVVEARLLMLLIDMKALASKMAIDCLAACIVDGNNKNNQWEIQQSFECLEHENQQTQNYQYSWNEVFFQLLVERIKVGLSCAV